MTFFHCIVKNPLKKGLILFKSIVIACYKRGSKRFFCQGWQRKILRILKANPFKNPYFIKASLEYSEHVGIKTHAECALEGVF